MMKCQKYPKCWIFLKRELFMGIKNDIPVCQMCKYKNTNTQTAAVHIKSPSSHPGGPLLDNTLVKTPDN